MERTPLLCPGGKQISSTDFFRNYWCSHYGTCLDLAAREDLFLDCTRCDYRNNVMDGFSLLIGRNE